MHYVSCALLKKYLRTGVSGVRDSINFPSASQDARTAIFNEKYLSAKQKVLVRIQRAERVV